MSDSLTPAQIRGARGMLDWSMMDLAEAAGVSVSTVKRIEHADMEVVSVDARGAVQGALEEEGMRFLSDNGDGIGMRLKR